MTALTPLEAALAGLLHDIGKLAQRAHPDETALRDAYGPDLAGTEATILPVHDGRYTHRHALWSDFFFRTLRPATLWPAGVDGARVEAVAARHHNPQDDNPADWIIAEADRLASGLERKEKDPAEEAKALSFRQAELLAMLPAVSLGHGEPPDLRLHHPAVKLDAETLLPQAAAPAGQPRHYGALWHAWCEGFASFSQHRLSPIRFERALLGLSERLLWAVPSSTVDQPDIGLHDHARAVAAIGAALAAWHADSGAWEVKAVQDRSIPKFRLAALDLSGIQHALFRLDGREGAARILRARSFLMGATVEAALLLLLDRLGLPYSSVLLNAGGKAELVIADLNDVEQRLDEVRARLDAWMVEHWQGDLGLVLAAGPPFAATEFLDRGKEGEVAEGYRRQRARLAVALEAAKFRPLAGWSGEGGFLGTGVIPTATFRLAGEGGAEQGPNGACAACGVRPAMLRTALDGAWRCVVCDAAYRLGQQLAKSDGWAILRADGDGAAPAALPEGWRLAPWSERGAEALVTVAFRRDDAGSAIFRPRAHVPILGDPADPKYRHAGIGEVDEAGRPYEQGELMTFAHIAAEALEVLEAREGRRIFGRDLVGIVKADVDRLGEVFARGLGRDRSPARTAQLSRLMDAYFAERLPWLLRREFPATYTVYAGGDDLLLVAPWRFALSMALRLREDFALFSGGNPNLTLSAGVAFVHPKHPLALAVKEAEEALEAAKRGGRNRIGVLGRVLGWDALKATLELAEELNALVREGALPPTVLYRMRWFAGRRAQAEGGDAAAADWNAKWRYHEARLLDRSRQEERQRLQAVLRRALPPPCRPQPADAEIAMTIALWRNR